MQVDRALSAILLVTTGWSAAAQEPIPVSPGRLVGSPSSASACPVFNFTGVEGAVGYELVALEIPAGVEEDDIGAATVALHVELPAGSSGWSPSLEECLEAGSRYLWAVRARLEEGEGEWSPPARFDVPLAPTTAELEWAMEILDRRRRALTDPLEPAIGHPLAAPAEAAVEGGGAGIASKLPNQHLRATARISGSPLRRPSSTAPAAADTASPGTNTSSGDRIDTSWLQDGAGEPVAHASSSPARRAAFTTRMVGSRGTTPPAGGFRVDPYLLELTKSAVLLTASEDIPSEVLGSLCADGDGCELRLVATDTSGEVGGFSAGGLLFVDTPRINAWRLNRYDQIATVVGTNGDTVGATMILVSGTSSCGLYDDGAGALPTYQLRIQGGDAVHCLLRIAD
jgi:hypothetical protein